MNVIEDSYRHKGLRRSLIQLLKEKGIKDENVLKAINEVPRHIFFDPAFINHAYQDKAFPIASGQTISQPYTVAFQSELLEISPGDKILEIGTGSGYQCSVLAKMGAKVFSIERQKELFDKFYKLMPSLKIRASLHYGDGTKGLPAFAPFDGIIVTAGAPIIPKELLTQLKIGGKLVIPVGDEKKQQMIRLRKLSERQIEKESFGDFSFVPLIGDDGW